MNLYVSSSDVAVMAVSALAALSFHITARAGALSIGQVAFMAVGAYAAAIFQRSGVPTIAIIVAAALVAGVIGGAIGYLLRTVSGIFLAIATAALIRVAQLFATGVPALGGVQGLFTKPVLDPVVAVMVAILATVGAVLMWRRPLGLAISIMGEDPELARSMGISTTLMRSSAFALGGAVAGLAGSLYALSTGYVGADLFGLPREIYIIFGAVLGGVMSAYGAPAGGALTALLLVLTRDFGQMQLVAFGLIALGCIILRPRGLLVVPTAGEWLRSSTFDRLAWVGRLTRKERA